MCVHRWVKITALLTGTSLNVYRSNWSESLRHLVLQGAACVKYQPPMQRLASGVSGYLRGFPDLPMDITGRTGEIVTLVFTSLRVVQ